MEEKRKAWKTEEELRKTMQYKNTKKKHQREKRNIENNTKQVCVMKHGTAARKKTEKFI